MSRPTVIRGVGVAMATLVMISLMVTVLLSGKIQVSSTELFARAFLAGSFLVVATISMFLALASLACSTYYMSKAATNRCEGVSAWDKRLHYNAFNVLWYSEYLTELGKANRSKCFKYQLKFLLGTFSTLLSGWFCELAVSI
jgi:hypothetical protein